MIIWWNTHDRGGGTPDFPDVGDVVEGVEFDNGNFVGTFRCIPRYTNPGGKDDIETFLARYEVYLKARLAQQISSVNTDKGDTLLQQIPANAWISHSLDKKAMNYPNFVFYFIENVETKANGPRLARTYTIETDIFTIDKNDGLIEKKFLRYQRALEESIVAAWNSIEPSKKLEIESLNPVDVKLFDSSYFHKVIGVSFKITIQ